MGTREARAERTARVMSTSPDSSDPSAMEKAMPFVIAAVLLVVIVGVCLLACCAVGGGDGAETPTCDCRSWGTSCFGCLGKVFWCCSTQAKGAIDSASAALDDAAGAPGGDAAPAATVRTRPRRPRKGLCDDCCGVCLETVMPRAPRGSNTVRAVPLAPERNPPPPDAVAERSSAGGGYLEALQDAGEDAEASSSARMPLLALGDAHALVRARAPAPGRAMVRV